MQPKRIHGMPEEWSHRQKAVRYLARGGRAPMDRQYTSAAYCGIDDAVTNTPSTLYEISRIRSGIFGP